jgi:hypothetical protein
VVAKLNDVRLDASVAAVLALAPLREWAAVVAASSANLALNLRDAFRHARTIL